MRLDAAVVGAARDDQALAHLGDALVVVGVDVVHDLAEDARGRRARLRRDAVTPVGAQPGAMRREVELGPADVLHERAAALDVHELEAAADAEHGQVTAARLAQQRELERVAHAPLRRRLVACPPRARRRTAPGRDRARR